METKEMPKLEKSDYLQYEVLKRAWIYENPGASSLEYAMAMRRIAKECKV